MKSIQVDYHTKETWWKRRHEEYMLCICCICGSTTECHATDTGYVGPLVQDTMGLSFKGSLCILGRKYIVCVSTWSGRQSLLYCCMEITSLFKHSSHCKKGGVQVTLGCPFLVFSTSTSVFAQNFGVCSAHSGVDAKSLQC